MEITWHFLVPEKGAPLRRILWHGRPAWVSARSGLPGAFGAAFTKAYELLADLFFFVNALFRPYDVIQVRDKFLAGLLGLYSARLRGIPFVYWLSYPFPEARLLDAEEGRSAHPWYTRLASRCSAALLYRVILPAADHVFVQSEQMKRDVLRPGFNAAKFTSVPMGIPDDDLPQDFDTKTADGSLILYLGTLARVRRLEILLQAMAQVTRDLPDARLVFVGEGDVRADRAFLEAETDHLRLRHCVTFAGQVGRQEALNWVRRAAVCLSPFYPSFVLRSASPTKLIEYMALSKVVVANDHPEQAQVIRDSGGGLCIPWSAADFTSAILRLLKDPDLAQEMGYKGRAWVEAHRRYTVIADQLFPIYAELAAPRRRSYPMNDKQTLLFVTGASRSGTTMLNRVLGAHDQILGMNELHYFGEIWDPNDLRPLNLEQRIRLAEWILARQARGIWGKGPSQFERAQARQLVGTMPDTTNGMMVYARVVRSLAAQSGKSIPCEQTPRNVLYANRLLEIDPQTKFI